MKQAQLIILVMGLPGSGKSYFASRLAAAIGAEYLNSDRLRKAMMAKRTYSDVEKGLVYEEMLKQMRQAVKQHKDLVADATFYKNAIREKFKDQMKNEGRIVFIEIVASELLIKERLKQNREDSEADFSVYKLVKAEWEPIPGQHLILQSTNDNINDMLYKAIDYLHVKNNDKGTN